MLYSVERETKEKTANDWRKFPQLVMPQSLKYEQRQVKSIFVKLWNKRHVVLYVNFKLSQCSHDNEFLKKRQITFNVKSYL